MGGWVAHLHRPVHVIHKRLHKRVELAAMAAVLLKSINEIHEGVLRALLADARRGGLTCPCGHCDECAHRIIVMLIERVMAHLPRGTKDGKKDMPRVTKGGIKGRESWRTDVPPPT